MSLAIVGYDEDIDALIADIDGTLTYLTACCQATATGSGGVTACRKCYEEVDCRIGMPVEEN